MGIKEKYTELKDKREPYLKRARDCALLTIPSLFPPEGENGGRAFELPYQSLGARGVNNLAGKLLLTLVPPNQPFFKLDLNRAMIPPGEVSSDMLNEFKEALAQVAQLVQSDIEACGDRAELFEAFRHLIISGNVLLEDTEDGLRLYTLENFCVRRDPMGNVIEIVAWEKVTYYDLPENVQPLVFSKLPLNKDKQPDTSADLELFTWIHREEKNWVVEQECEGVVIDGAGTYPLDSCPWLPLRFQRPAREDYGRSFVEEYLGDLNTLDGAEQALLEGGAAAAKVLLLVNPNGVTNLETFQKAKSGDCLAGTEQDVAVLQFGKGQDFRTLGEIAARKQRDLEFVFLLNTAIQRDAERVTREEIRMMAAELETALGGVYTVLTKEFQLPYVAIKLRKLKNKKMLGQFPKGDLVQAKIITGMDALGRGAERNKLIEFVGTIGQVLGPQAVAQWVDVPQFIRTLAVTDGIDPNSILRDADEVAAEQAQAQQMALVQQFGPNVIDAAAKAGVAGVQQKAQIVGGGTESAT